MSAQLTRQQVNDFRIQLMSRFMEMQRDLEQESQSLFDRGNDAVDPELEGCIDLLFDLNYIDMTGVSTRSSKKGRDL